MERADSASAVTSKEGSGGWPGQPGAGRPAGPQPSATGNLLVRPGQPAWEQTARRTAHWAMTTAGRPLHQAHMLPRFLIAGAERCGTTSLWEALKQHPAIFSALLPRKELHFFDYQYDRGLAWYRCHFPFRALARLAGRGAGAAPVTFEASPYYMFHPLAPQRINRDLPGVKVLVMLRDPVSRAYSAHVMRVARGFETEPFERALELEDSRLAGEAERLAADPSYVSYNHRHFAYRARGHYAEQLENLERVFGRERIHVIDSADFFTDPAHVYDGVLDFLDLPHRGYPAFERPATRSRPEMPAAVRNALEEHFRPHNERLIAWLGHEPSWCR